MIRNLGGNGARHWQIVWKPNRPTNPWTKRVALQPSTERTNRLLRCCMKTGCGRPSGNGPRSNLMAKVLDSSAVLAFLYDEPGAEKVRPDLPGGIISAVNAAEVLAVLVRKGAPLEEAVLALQKTRLQVQEFSAAVAVKTVDLQFRSHSLSLGDQLGSASC